MREREAGPSLSTAKVRRTIPHCRFRRRRRAVVRKPHWRSIATPVPTADDAAEMNRLRLHDRSHACEASPNSLFGMHGLPCGTKNAGSALGGERCNNKKAYENRHG